jgi:hypothetical protein
VTTIRQSLYLDFEQEAGRQIVKPYVTSHWPRLTISTLGSYLIRQCDGKEARSGGNWTTRPDVVFIEC